MSARAPPAHGDEVRHGAAGRRRPRAAARGSAADRPARARWRRGRRRDSPGASRCSRASPSDSRSPRLEVTSACSSSSTTRRSWPNRARRLAVRQQQRELLRAWSAGCRAGARSAGRACGPRCRRCASRCATGSAISRDGRLEVARDVDGERLQRRDIERVQAACASTGRPLRPARPGSAGSRPASCRRRWARSSRADRPCLGERQQSQLVRHAAASPAPTNQRQSGRAGRIQLPLDAISALRTRPIRVDHFGAGTGA